MDCRDCKYYSMSGVGAMYCHKYHQIRPSTDSKNCPYFPKKINIGVDVGVKNGSKTCTIIRDSLGNICHYEVHKTPKRKEQKMIKLLRRYMVGCTLVCTVIIVRRLFPILNPIVFRIANIVYAKFCDYPLLPDVGEDIFIAWLIIFLCGLVICGGIFSFHRFTKLIFGEK